MQDHDKKRFVAALSALAAVFRIEPTEALITGYWIGLRSLPVESFERAVGRALEGSKRMPVAAELRELAGEMPASVEAVHAWAAVKRAIREHGTYRSIDFGPAGNATVRALGGWVRLCGTESEELDKWTRKDFERIYTAFAVSGVSETEGGHLVGIFEETNSLGGFAIEPPVQVALIEARGMKPKQLPEA